MRDFRFIQKKYLFYHRDDSFVILKAPFLVQGIFDNPSLDTPSHLSSVTDLMERDTLEYFYVYFTLDFRQFDIRHPLLFLRNRYNTLHVFFV